ncbi:MAG: hypothetical protein IPF62_08110 [Bacteroidetes bacterium]|nr:hypothetical protein [Bacteroidota bacterium]
MGRIIEFGIFYLLMLTSNIVFAQQTSFNIDSTIFFQLLSIDTGSKVAVKKEINTYNNDQQLIEKKVFIFDKKKSAWLPQKRFVFNYFKSEIMINCFNNESAKQEIQIARYILLLDLQQHIIECTKLDKERYADKYHRRSKYELTYKGDTLRSKKYFEQGTLFYKKEEITYEYAANKITLREKSFTESGDELKTKKQVIYTLNNDLKRIQYFNNKNELISKDTFYYQHDTLLQMDAINYHGGKSLTEKLKYRIFYNSQQGKISSTVLLYFNDAKKPVADDRNSFVQYTPKSNNLKKIRRILYFDAESFLE